MSCPFPSRLAGAPTGCTELVQTRRRLLLAEREPARGTRCELARSVWVLVVLRIGSLGPSDVGTDETARASCEARRGPGDAVWRKSDRVDRRRASSAWRAHEEPKHDHRYLR